MADWATRGRLAVFGLLVAGALFVTPGPEPLSAGFCSLEFCSEVLCYYGPEGDPTPLGYWIEQQD